MPEIADRPIMPGRKNGLSVQLLIEVLDAGGIVADDEGLQILDGADDGARLPLESMPRPSQSGRVCRSPP